MEPSAIKNIWIDDQQGAGKQEEEALMEQRLEVGSGRGVKWFRKSKMRRMDWKPMEEEKNDLGRCREWICKGGWWKKSSQLEFTIGF